MLFEHTDQATPETLDNPFTWAIKPLRWFDLGLCHFLTTRSDLTKINTNLPHPHILNPSPPLDSLLSQASLISTSFSLQLNFPPQSKWTNCPSAKLQDPSESLFRAGLEAASHGPQLGACTAAHHHTPQSAVPLSLACHSPDAFPKAVDAT